MTICDISPAIMENQENKRSKIQYPPLSGLCSCLWMYMHVQNIWIHISFVKSSSILALSKVSYRSNRDFKTAPWQTIPVCYCSHPVVNTFIFYQCVVPFPKHGLKDACHFNNRTLQLLPSPTIHLHYPYSGNFFDSLSGILVITTFHFPRFFWLDGKMRCNVNRAAWQYTNSCPLE